MRTPEKRKSSYKPCPIEPTEQKCKRFLFMKEAESKETNEVRILIYSPYYKSMAQFTYNDSVAGRKQRIILFGYHSCSHCCS